MARVGVPLNSGGRADGLRHARKTGSSPHTLLLFAARDRRNAVGMFDAYLSDPHVAIQEWSIRGPNQ
jgi:hypothetical protein